MQLNEYELKLLQQNKNETINNELCIKEDQQIRNLTFIEGIEANKLVLNECFKVQLHNPPRNITSLVLISCNITNISGLKSMIWLKKLVLSKNPISNISAVSELVNLEYLSVNNTELVDIKCIQPLVNLKELEFNSTNVSDISVLEHLTNLDVLDLRHNQISDISSLKYQQRLTYLNLAGNKITDFTPLQRLTSLTELDLSQNTLHSAFILLNLLNLTTLNLGECKLVDVTSLAHLKKIQSLNVEHNHITCIEPLLKLKLEHVDIERNLVRYNVYPFIFMRYINKQNEPTVQQNRMGDHINCIYKVIALRVKILKRRNKMKSKIQKLKQRSSENLNMALERQYCFSQKIVNLVLRIEDDGSYLQ
ncbi:leucine-rich_repeat domain-containing protein [Hexamita inflata]|uniref:Leucine-rich repeat domain-containing protein n=1 Tax=Hexamita inflata TaxID=28002 RepID=A0AA86TJL1_9EUKA|nr:leucine-rich repeat domain-containing protein [Hexamita inflata]